MKKILALLLCAALAWPLYAQSHPAKGAVSGRLPDTAQQALSYSNVLADQAANSFLFSPLTFLL